MNEKIAMTGLQRNMNPLLPRRYIEIHESNECFSGGVETEG